VDSLRDRLLGNGLFFWSRAISRSCRFQVSGFAAIEERRQAGEPTILAAWHGMTMMLGGFFLNHFDLASLVLLLPDDWRGANLAVWARRLGARPFRLNLKGDSTMAAARQVAGLVRLVKEGHDCYITPDGPDGPAYEPKPGVAYIAQKTGAAVIPVGAYARHGYRLNRWDRYVVPYPFSRISIVVGRPLGAPDGGEPVSRADGQATILKQLTAALHEVTMQAAANYYEKRA
jgi:lysophospholipid acyltransferase (LPLAT)-like uncharacterized protein